MKFHNVSVLTVQKRIVMDALGLGGLPLANSTNIEVLKKALQTKETMLGDILNSASANNQAPLKSDTSLSSDVRSLVAETTNKGGSLDLSA